MQVTIDISMYPNREDFIPPIDGFIEKINQFDNLKVTTFPTSTVVQGDYVCAMKQFRIRLQPAMRNLIWRFM